jgi:hypothetical protein
MKTRKVFLFVGFLLFASMAFILSSSTAMAGVVEICDNKVDDDSDKLADCDDPDCAEECKKDITADCSPGFYKNRLLNVDLRKRLCPITCPVATEGIIDNAECAQLVIDLSAELGSDEATRSAAKATLDACFGTAEASPCEDD